MLLFMTLNSSKAEGTHQPWGGHRTTLLRAGGEGVGAYPMVVCSGRVCHQPMEKFEEGCDVLLPTDTQSCSRSYRGEWKRHRALQSMLPSTPTVVSRAVGPPGPPRAPNLLNM